MINIWTKSYAVVLVILTHEIIQQLGLIYTVMKFLVV
jgi:hypothetical protein